MSVSCGMASSSEADEVKAKFKWPDFLFTQHTLVKPSDHSLDFAFRLPLPCF
jgi:hypothetical protein